MPFDLIIKGGDCFDGSGDPAKRLDVAVQGDRIAKVGALEGEEAGAVIDATGMAVAPGFINMLSHSYFSALHDGRSLGELKQGVTTQLIGEGWSMGPLTETTKTELNQFKGRLEIELDWTRISEFLANLEKRGVSQNFGSLIGATTLRINAVGYENRPADDKEIDLMKNLVEEEMTDGAFGIGSALIYAPGSYAPTEELVEICSVAGRYGGNYFSHMRSEGDRLIEAVDELMDISRRAEIPAEIWHLKAIGPSNWPKMAELIEKVEKARSSGEPITADLYPYNAGATFLSAAIPPWFHEGGTPKLLERLEDPAVREEIRNIMGGSLDPGREWENLYGGSGGADGVLIMSIFEEVLRQHQGKRLAQVAAERGTDPIDTLMDLVVEAKGRIGAAFFIISEGNITQEIGLPWVAFGSDASSMAPEGVFLEGSPHPRSYGTFSRVLGRYVREEKALSLAEAIRRLTSFPAETLNLDRRGSIKEGHFADLVVFDPQTVGDTATYEAPHQLALGVRDVIVNGRPALRDGEFAGELPGRALSGRAKRS